MNRLTVILTCWVITISTMAQEDAPAPIYPVPTEHQVAWQGMETYAFIHFGPNTFLNQEWGYGNADPQSFNPAKLDTDQWARTLSEAGMKGVILTAKHHDGFCLWPSKYTDYSIKNSPYRNGEGDIVGELAASCRKYGIKLGIYLSPWDRHHHAYGTQQYIEYYYAQLEELLTGYDTLFEIWFDGANGGDGWYGGTNERRTIDRRSYYNWQRAHEMVARLQPQAVIFSDGGPGCRWVGNENGHAGATNWSFLRIGEVYPGYDKYQELTSGHADGDAWVAAECDVSIRPGWFYHAAEDSMVKSVDQLVDLYFNSVGHNATLLLNFPVTNDGLIHPVDSARAVAFHRLIENTFSHNLLANAHIKASHVRDTTHFGTHHLLDANPDTYWATPDGITTSTLMVTMPSSQRINCLMLQEYITLGQRVSEFNVEYYDSGEWHTLDTGEPTTTIGYKRLLRFNTITTNRLRINLTSARGPLCISEIGAFCAT